MLQLVLRKNHFDLYSVAKFTGTPLDALADFLVSDGSEWIDYNDAHYEHDPYIVWLRDKNQRDYWAGGNSMEMIKHGNRIFLDSQFRDNRDDYSTAFSTTTENMISILKHWYDILVMDPLPMEVHLVQDSDSVVLMPKFNENQDVVIMSALAIKK